MRRSFPLVVLLLAAAAPANADAAGKGQAWVSGGVRYRPTKGLWLGFTQHLRWDNRTSPVRKFMPQFTGRYRIARFLRVGGGYRLIVERYREFVPAEGLQFRYRVGHRVFLDLRPSYKAGSVRFDYRLRAQVTGVEGVAPVETVVRHRVGIRVETDAGLSPYLNGELFVLLGEAGGLTKWRVTLGLPYEFGAHEIDVFYRAQRPTGTGAETWHIFGLGYRYSIR